MKNAPEQIIIDGVKYVREPEPEVEYEPDRLVYFWDNGEYEKYKHIEAANFSEVKNKWERFKPVHRRWNELTKLERIFFTNVCDVAEEQAYIIYKAAYTLQSQRQHP